MRIILIGQAAFGAKVLETLLEKGENVVAAYTPPDKPSGRPDPLNELALSKNISTFQPETYKDDQVFKEFKGLNPDLTVMAFVTDIIPARYFELPSKGTINYHPSLLPRHRGASAINWAVIMGDTTTGLSIFWPDGGIDTGPVLLQKEIVIGPDDTTGSLYFNHLFPMGVEAIIESIEAVKENRAPKIAQNEAEATYEPPCDDRVSSIDWSKPAWQVYNFVRGCDPQPGACAFLKKEKIRFYGAKLIETPIDKTVGTILQIDSDGMHVAALGAKLIISKIKSDKCKKMPAYEFANQEGLKPGDRFDA